MEKIIKKENFETEDWLEEGEVVIIYKASQYKGRNNKSEEPNCADVSYHINYFDSLKAIIEIHPKVGYKRTIEKLLFNAEEFFSLLDNHEYNSLTQKDFNHIFNFLINGQLSFKAIIIYDTPEYEIKYLPENSILIFYNDYHNEISEDPINLIYDYNILKVVYAKTTKWKTWNHIDFFNEEELSFKVFVSENIDKLEEFYNDRLIPPFNKRLLKEENLITKFLNENINKGQ